ncbi:alpha/beta fold hydrolase [Puniceicoccus vermicola]|uniref:Alpha/beta hydrolase n=1 Tax=Puniceicoccus vermicola TaxID=388746 RepID=A0A7X1E4C0_9BACT|nr:alpha/beta hydrolase [Puniceicoccus vermicola]
MILNGDFDRWAMSASFEIWGEELHKSIPSSTLRIIDGAVHLVIEEKPNELVREILAFRKS